ncbi:MAG: hypothetical protein J0H29_14870 [Sphingobacteriales bacterium]|nr:hypothetical protein [Sphingobacteriales bacterium]OJY92053.1 MAG: hypothetical protein BGP14_24445 [Sphingobacteriales bacterium 44-15]
MRNQLLLMAFVMHILLFAKAQQSVDYTWRDPSTVLFPVIEGQAWPTETGNRIERFPYRIKKILKQDAGSFDTGAGGLSISFISNSPEILVRYQLLPENATAHAHMYGVDGVGLFGTSKDGEWFECPGTYSFADSVTYRFNIRDSLKAISLHQKGGVFKLYLPSGCRVQWLEVGSVAGAVFRYYPVRKEKPIVVFRTSLIQPVPPGKNWYTLLERRLDRTVIDLPFPRSTTEKEVVNIMSEPDAAMYVLDCLPGLTGKLRICQAVRSLRKVRSHVPILLIDHAVSGTPGTYPETYKKEIAVDQLPREIISELQKEGVDQLYYLNMDEAEPLPKGIIKAVSATDSAMQFCAMTCEKKIRGILNEPSGQITTTIPCTQYRDANTYDWRDRHREILELQKTAKEPVTIFLGNSITHYWGGSSLQRGKDSWNNDIVLFNPVNAGFGWDRIENVLWRVYHDELDGFEARQIVVLIGTNNLEYNTDKEIIEGLEQLMLAIRVRQSKAALLLCGIIPREGKEHRIQALNKGIAQLAASLRIDYADPGKFLAEEDGKIIEQFFTGDGVHPNEAGYHRVSSELIRHLVR